MTGKYKIPASTWPFQPHQGVGNEHPREHTFGSHSDIDKAADQASAGAFTPPTSGIYFDVTGTTGITSIATRDAGDLVIMQFDASLTMTHLAGTLDLRGNVDFAARKGSVIGLISEGSGAWREIFRSETAGGLKQGFQAPALTVVVNTHTHAAAGANGADGAPTKGDTAVVNTTTFAAIDST